MLRAPGVYVEEVPSGPRPIRAVGTSTAAFLGVPPRAQAKRGEVVSLSSWSRFLDHYVDPNAQRGTALSQAVYAYFMNGGQRCYVVNIGDDEGLEEGLLTLEGTDEVAIVVAPGRTDAAGHDAVITHCEKLRDRVGILDMPAEVEEIDDLKRPAQVGGDDHGGLKPRQTAFAASYFPWILAKDPLGDADPIPTAPSGSLAGVWARTDAMRGVHKAPANEPIRGALGLTQQITRAEQAGLNENGINCIRLFPQEGIRIWGARTMAGGSSEWTYLNVRRLFNMIEESIMEGTRWMVFEPNDRTLWQHARRDVTAFLMQLWRDGALMGATPEQAFFVQCDEETNPMSEVEKGVVTIRVGVCPVRPAEFVVFKVSQYSGGMEAEAESGA